MTYLAKRFEEGAKPAPTPEIASELGVPSRLVGRVLEPLVEGHLVLEVACANQTGYAPARPLENISCHDILHIMRVYGGQELDTRQEPSRSVVNAEFQKIQTAESQVASSVTLKDLVSKIHGGRD